MNIQEFLKAPIIPKSQIGNFKVGDSVSAYENILKPAEYDLWKVEAIYPKYYEYSLLESLRILVNIYSGKICQITAQKNYQGKYLEKIGIGTSIGKILEFTNDVSFDMENVIIGRDYDLILRIDNDDETIHSLDEIMDNKIVEMIVEDRTLF